MEWFKKFFESVREFVAPTMIEQIDIYMWVKPHFDKPLVCYLFTEKYGMLTLMEKERVKINAWTQEIHFHCELTELIRMNQVMHSVVKVYDINNVPVESIRNFRMACS